MLVAECPRKAQLLCEKLCEVDEPGATFEYSDDVDERLILLLMATVPLTTGPPPTKQAAQATYMETASRECTYKDQ